ncbi:MAG: delta-60 repeat domain-containing protein [Cyclobacteriaceae bacterium]
MKYTSLYILLIAILWSCTPTDDESPAPSDIFVKYYGSAGTEVVDVVRSPAVTLKGDTVDNFIILATNSDNQITVIKVNHEGNQVASTDFKDWAVSSSHVPKRIKSISNGQFLIVGHAQSLDFPDSVRGIWAKIDENLQLIGNPHVVGSDSDDKIKNLFLTDIIESYESDGVEKVILFGHTRNKLDNNPSDDMQLYISKKDYSDSTYWEKLNGFGEDEESLAIFQNDYDSSLVLIGSANSTTQGTNVYVVQTNKLGTADQGSLNTGVSGSQANADDIPYAAIKTSLGYSVVGSTTSAAGSLSGFHMAFTTGGQLVSGSSHVLESSFGTEWQAFGVTRSVDNGLIVVGSAPSFAGVGEGSAARGEEAILMKINPLNGRDVNLEDQSFGTTVGNDRAVAAITLPDGDILVAATFDFGSGTTLAGLMRLNRNGELRD